MMRRLVISVLLASGCLTAQWADFSSNTASANLYNAINGKTNFQTSTSACVGLNGTVAKDFCLDTVTGWWYSPSVTGTPATWARVNATANAATATALASAPAGCSGGQVATGIAANGTATCITVTAAQVLNFRVLCQNTLAGSPFSEPAVNGASHSCDSAWSSMDGYESFANGATNYALLGPFNLTAAFADPIKVTIWFNSASTSGTFQPSMSALCVPSGGSITTNWWTSASYQSFTNTTTSGTAGVDTVIPQLSYTTGCSTGLLYLSIRATGSATPASGANIKLATITGIQ